MLVYPTLITKLTNHDLKCFVHWQRIKNRREVKKPVPLYQIINKAIGTIGFNTGMNCDTLEFISIKQLDCASMVTGGDIQTCPAIVVSAQIQRGKKRGTKTKTLLSKVVIKGDSKVPVASTGGAAADTNDDVTMESFVLVHSHQVTVKLTTITGNGGSDPLSTQYLLGI